MKIEIVKYEPPQVPDELEMEKHYGNKKYYCPSCKKSTTFARCLDCGKRFCLSHCEREQNSWEEGGGVYHLCYHCDG